MQGESQDFARLPHPELRLVLAQHGYLSEEDWPELEASLCELNPDLVFVALGVPRQELWTQRLKATQTGAWMGVGGSFDVWAGLKERASSLIKFSYCLSGLIFQSRDSRKLDSVAFSKSNTTLFFKSIPLINA